MFRGHVEAIATGGFRELGERLAGPLLARFSAALWKGRPHAFDVLGVALRFGGEQDLLFASIRSPFTMPVAPLATDTADFFANHYWAVSPFAVAGVGRLKFRLTPLPAAGETAGGGHRYASLVQAVAHGPMIWRLDARRVFHPRYQPIAHLVLDELAADLDQAALRFDPFLAGHGIVPSGLVHAIRPAAYTASQRGRPFRSA